MKDFLKDFDTDIPELNKKEDIFDKLQDVVYEMAMHGDEIYTSSKTNLTLSELRKLQETEYYKEEFKKVKEEIKKDGGDPIKTKSRILAHVALDRLHKQMIDNDIKESDRTKACTVMLEIAGHLNGKEDVKQVAPIMIQFKDATFETKK